MTNRERQELLAFAGPQPRVNRFTFETADGMRTWTAVALTSEAAEKVITEEHSGCGKLSLVGITQVPCLREHVRKQARQVLDRELQGEAV